MQADRRQERIKEKIRRCFIFDNFYSDFLEPAETGVFIESPEKRCVHDVIKAVNAGAVLVKVLDRVETEQVSVGCVFAHVLKKRPEVRTVERITLPAESHVVFRVQQRHIIGRFLCGRAAGDGNYATYPKEFFHIQVVAFASGCRKNTASC